MLKNIIIFQRQKGENQNEAKKLSRRDFIKISSGAALGATVGTLTLNKTGCSLVEKKPVVSVVKIINENISFVVEKAIELIGGIKRITK